MKGFAFATVVALTMLGSAALPVVAVTPDGTPNGYGMRVRLTGDHLFVGADTQVTYPANTAFWVGGGFVAATTSVPDKLDILDPSTTVEMTLNGSPTHLNSEVDTDPPSGLCTKMSYRNFPDGLPAGIDVFDEYYIWLGALYQHSHVIVPFV